MFIASRIATMIQLAWQLRNSECYNRWMRIGSTGWLLILEALVRLLLKSVLSEPIFFILARGMLLYDRFVQWCPNIQFNNCHTNHVIHCGSQQIFRALGIDEGRSANCKIWLNGISGFKIRILCCLAQGRNTNQYALKVKREGSFDFIDSFGNRRACLH